MKNVLLIALTFALISCKKDKEVISETTINDSLSTSKIDSAQVPTIEDPENPGAFVVTPQNLQADLGKTVFMQNGKGLFSYNQTSNNGSINIDGKEYALNKYDFSENTYTISGGGVVIEATDGDFQEQTSDCLYGNFPEIKITLNGKSIKLANVKVQDCPSYN